MVASTISGVSAKSKVETAHPLRDRDARACSRTRLKS
jgi:hypothetical protein